LSSYKKQYSYEKVFAILLRKGRKLMHEFKEGDLKSGSGKKVTTKKQAIAIGLSEARKEGAKTPKKNS
jgi:hypothetical protein